MQQLIQQRITTHSYLNRAKVLINTWNEVHSKSLSILQSICNIVSQKKSALEQPELIEIHYTEQQSLVFKQTESLGSLIKKLGMTLELMEDVSKGWNKLNSEVSKFLTKLLDRPESTPQPLSTESMIQVAAVDPVDLYEMVGCISYSYGREYKCKYNLFDDILFRITTPKEAYNLLEIWQADSFIAKKTEEDLLERIRLFNLTKKVLESVD